jgi:hypothetical protein
LYNIEPVDVIFPLTDKEFSPLTSPVTERSSLIVNCELNTEAVFAVKPPDNDIFTADKSEDVVIHCSLIM